MSVKKHLLFYGNPSNDQNSQYVINIINKNPIIKSQLILICLDDPSIQIPKTIREVRKNLILVLSESSKVLVDQDVCRWIQQVLINSRKNDEKGSFLNHELEAFSNNTDQYAPYNNELLTQSRTSTIYSNQTNGLHYADINSIGSTLSTNIEMVNGSKTKSEWKQEFDKRYADYKMQRDLEVSKPYGKAGIVDMSKFITGISDSNPR